MVHTFVRDRFEPEAKQGNGGFRPTAGGAHAVLQHHQKHLPMATGNRAYPGSSFLLAWSSARTPLKTRVRRSYEFPSSPWKEGPEFVLRVYRSIIVEYRTIVGTDTKPRARAWGPSRKQVRCGRRRSLPSHSPRQYAARFDSREAGLLLVLLVARLWVSPRPCGRLPVPQRQNPRPPQSCQRPCGRPVA